MENYEVLNKIGSGACGAVYLVRRKDSQRQYALKKVQIDERKKSRTHEAVLKEVRILESLKHPHIVGYHDSFFASDPDANFIHIVQDYCDNGTLDEKIVQKKQEGGYFHESLIMEWFIQIAMAVQYIHSKKILHRDLKPQNIFMTKKEGVKLGDFGIAKVLDSTIDAAVTCVGTPCYLSPELCNDVPYSSKSDIWALGCMLYEMCALVPAFDGQNLISLFYKITNAEYRKMPDNFSNDLKQLLANVLVKQPEKRLSASAILNLPYVNSYLDTFIKEKEYLLKQRSSHPKCKLSSYSANVSSSPKIPELRSNPAAEELRSCDFNSQLYDENSHYSDDFDSNGSSDDETGSPINKGSKIKVLGLEECGPSALEECHDDLDAAYDDDFEDDSDTENLDDIVNKAKQVHLLQVDDETFYDEHHTQPVTSIRQFLGLSDNKDMVYLENEDF